MDDTTTQQAPDTNDSPYGILTNPATQDASPAQSAAPAQQPSNAQPPQVEHDSSMDNAQIPKVEGGDQQFNGMPLQPVRRSGLAGIVDEIRDAIAGKTTSQVYQDDAGNKYIQHPDLTSGQKWLRIAGTAIHGAAAGLANGQGPGGGARAFAAGVQAGDKEAEQRKQKEQAQNEEVKQAQLDKFNTIKLQHDQAANEFALTRMKVQAQQQDVQFSQGQIDREKGLGSADLGVYKDPADLTRVKEQNPQFWKDVYAGNIVTVPEISTDGTRQGIHVFLRTPGIGSQLVDKGTQVMDFVPGDKPNDPPKLVPRTLSIPATNDQVDSWNASAVTKYQAWMKSKQEADDKATDVNLKKEQTKTQKTDQTKNIAEANKANVEAALAKSKSGDDSTLVDMIGTGKMPAGRLSYVMARNPDLLTKVAKAYPDFDASKIDAYTKVVADFESTHKGSTGNALNSGATALKHLKELRDLNTTRSHIPHTADWTAYKNKADTLSTELAAFYGDSTIPAIDHIKSTLTSTLPGNRDSAITHQAQSMGDKLDSYEQTWKQAAPSKSYEAPMPQIDDKAKDARAELDPSYKQRRVAEMQGQPQPAQQTAQQPVQQPTPQTHAWSASAWQQSHLGQDVNAAKAAAQQQGFQVVN